MFFGCRIFEGISLIRCARFPPWPHGSLRGRPRLVGSFRRLNALSHTGGEDEKEVSKRGGEL